MLPPLTNKASVQPARRRVAVLDEPLSVEAAIAGVEHPEAGALDLFIGTVRDHSGGRSVHRLDYEAYLPMAEAEFHRILDEAEEKWPLRAIWVEHRVGSLHIGDAAVVIAVASPHRAEAFEACRFIIEATKERVPIWKKEFFQDGEVWVSAHP